MNILILSPFFPYPLSQGGKIRVFNIIKYLSKNHRITLACLADEMINDYGPLENYCEEIIVMHRKSSTFADLSRFLLGREPFNYLKYSSARMRETLEKLIRRKAFDLVQIEFSLMWQYANIFKGIPVALDAHNIESEIVGQIKEKSGNPLKNLLYVREEKRLRQKEEETWHTCDICFAVSDKESDVISSRRGQSNGVFTIPNGVDLDRFTFNPKPEGGRQMLFIGGLEYHPNFDSALYLLKEIYPAIKSRVLDIKLDIVGRQLQRIRGLAPSGEIAFHDNVPDVLPYFRKADLLLVPLRQGAGTRIKILEAMGAGLPVVTTPKGCEGIDVKHGEHLLIADSPVNFALAVRSLLKDTELRRSITQRARKLIEEKYSWERLVREMEMIYQKA